MHVRPRLIRSSRTICYRAGYVLASAWDVFFGKARIRARYLHICMARATNFEAPNPLQLPADARHVSRSLLASNGQVGATHRRLSTLPPSQDLGPPTGSIQHVILVFMPGSSFPSYSIGTITR